MLSANVNRLLVLLRMVLEVTLVSARDALNRYCAVNHSRKHCRGAATAAAAAGRNQAAVQQQQS